MTTLLTEDQIDHFRTRAGSLAHPREIAIDVLRAIQDAHGWIPDEGVEQAARSGAEMIDLVFRQQCRH
ncbi:MAG: hypothetical protein P8Z70_07965, partial [Desulfuromonadales bacterium]